MKPWIGLATSFLLSAQAFGAISTEQRINEKIINVSIDNVELVDVNKLGNTFSSIKLEGAEGHEGILFKEGYPELPVVRFNYLLDEGQSLTVNSKRSNETIKATRKITPSVYSAPKIKGHEAELKLNRAAYSSNSFYPDNSYSIKTIGSVKGKRQVQVTLHPVQLNATSGEIRLIKNFSLKLENSIEQREAGDSLFVFIVGAKYQTSTMLQTYIELKEEQGFKVETLIMGSGVSTSSDIRTKLQEFLNEEGVNLEYALIIGDIEDVPSGTPSFIKSSYVTDHIYRAIDTNDYKSDIGSPDIGVGRITVKNMDELDTTLEKLYKYQTNILTEDILENISFIATDDKYEVAEATHNYAIDTYTKTLGYQGAFPFDLTEGGDRLYAITHKANRTTLINNLKKGKSIINYSGHGWTTYWAGPYFYGTDINTFEDTGMYPFVISNACVTGQFTIKESFGESWIKHPKGAVMFWGSMDNTYWDEDDILEKSMYDGIFKLGLATFKDITQNALSEVYKYYGGNYRSKYYYETYVVFGDPSVELQLVQ